MDTKAIAAVFLAHFDTSDVVVSLNNTPMTTTTPNEMCVIYVCYWLGKLRNVLPQYWGSLLMVIEDARNLT